MSDISACNDHDCSVSKYCWRYCCPKDGLIQSYLESPRKPDEDMCDMLIDMRKKPKEWWR